MIDRKTFTVPFGHVAVRDAEGRATGEVVRQTSNSRRNVMEDQGLKVSNPKDNIGIRKWRQFAAVPLTVIAEIGVGMLEGHLKGYRRHNFRVAGVRASVYVDAAIGHIMQWWEGEDLDPDTGLSHITKAMCSLVVLRDAMIQAMLNDDRPPKGNLDQVRADLKAVVDSMFEKYPEGHAPFTEIGEQRLKAMTEVRITNGLSEAAIKALKESGFADIPSDSMFSDALTEISKP
ncbi:DUF5664 domain-containing protein [Mesorhizobium sp. M0145]|uniref:dATP/dGTP diphosphohydrolase domain-containing protein n=1 Tax=Mesorhizobium sp. M0145 TaxID=2956895 RepID=UPI00333ADAF3